MSDAGINWKGILFWVLAIALIAFVVLYYFDVAHFKTNLVAFVHSIGIPKLNLSFTGITDFLKNNAAIIGVATPLGITAISYFIKNYQTNKLLDQKIAELTDTKLSLTQKATTREQELQKQIDELNGDTTAQSLQESLLKSQGSIDTLQARYDESQKLIKRLQEQLDARPVIQTTRIG